jgi:DeoR family suf operon transcriptional repressor
MAVSSPSGTKQEILQLLMKRELGAAALADALRISGAAIRQHLQTLEALGWVERRKEGSQPGRPAYLYRLSDEGKRRFRQRHDLLLRLIVEVLLRREGCDALKAIVAEAAERLAVEIPVRAAAEDRQARWRDVLDWLEAQLDWNADTMDEPGGRSRIVIHQCPFQAVSKGHPEICGTFFSTLIRMLYGDAAVLHEPGADKPACCALIVQHPAS